MSHLSLPLHTALREAVAARFGQPVRYPSHCDALENELKKTDFMGAKRLIPSTLRRFFGLVKSEGGHHLHTLDTLARYAGHTDFSAFGRAMTSLAEGAKPAAAAPADVPELLAMAQLSYPERLLLGYFLGRATRPATPTGPAAPLALRLAAHPAGREFFVESFVDLAYLNGAYGEVLREYLRHKPTAEAQLFGHCTLFLGEFLVGDEPAWRARLRQVLALPVPAGTHAFPRGRRAFAEIVAAAHDAPDGQAPPALLVRLRAEAAAVPRPVGPAPPLPAFYNLFPAGYHFFVAEALFLTGQFAALLDWVNFTNAAFPELASLQDNVYQALLQAFRAVAALRTRQGIEAIAPVLPAFNSANHGWLLGYYQVHLWLTELHFAAVAPVPSAIQLQQQIQAFADRHRMPFFQQVAARITFAANPEQKQV